jgi:acyl carrier protein
VTTIEDFIALLDEEIGLQVAADQIEDAFDQLPDWDSVKLLWLATALEKAIGLPVRFADLLEATSLGDVYRLAVATVKAS